MSPCAFPLSNLKFLLSLESFNIMHAVRLVASIRIHFRKFSPKLKKTKTELRNVWLKVSKALLMSSESSAPLIFLVLQLLIQSETLISTS